MRTYRVAVFDEDAPRLRAVAERLWKLGYLGVNCPAVGNSMTFDDDVYDVLGDLGTGVDGYVCKYGMGIGDRLYDVRQVA